MDRHTPRAESWAVMYTKLVWEGRQIGGLVGQLGSVNLFRLFQ